MNDRKLRIAFAKVKKDIIGIQEDLYDLAKEQANNNGNQVQAQPNKDLKFNNFVTNVENELKALTLFTKELEDRITHIQSSKTKSVSMPVQTSSGNKDLEDNFEQLERKFIDFTELINEKVDMEINSLRLEFTEEIAKVYDRVFTEVLELKDEIKGKKSKVKEEKPKKEKKKLIKKSTKNQKISSQSDKVKKEVKEEKKDEDLYQSISETTDKEPGRLKKVMNWLFVDEEEEDINNIKSQVKVKEEDRDELY